MPTIDFGHWNGRRNRLPRLADQSFGEVGGAGGFACRWKLISIAHPNPENGYAPVAQSCVGLNRGVLCRQRRLSSRRVFLSLASLGFFPRLGPRRGALGNPLSEERSDELNFISR